MVRRVAAATITRQPIARRMTVLLNVAVHISTPVEQMLSRIAAPPANFSLSRQ